MATWKFSLTGFKFDINDDTNGSIVARYYDNDTTDKKNTTLVVNGKDYIPISDLPAPQQATIANIKEHIRVYADNLHASESGVPVGGTWRMKSGVLQGSIVTGEEYDRLEVRFYDSQYITEEEISVDGENYNGSVANMTTTQQEDIQAFADYLRTLIP